MQNFAEPVSLSLHEIGAIKTGKFVLKSKAISNIYYDMREIPSFPKTFSLVSQALKQLIPKDFQIICGVPIAAISYATYLSIETSSPLIIVRKEAKDHGTRKMIEGVYQKGQNCLIVEDVLTTGTSILEVTKILRENGLVVTDAIVILNREEGGAEKLAKEGVRLHHVLTTSQLLDCLIKNGKIENMKPEVIYPEIRNETYGDRSLSSKNSIAKKLFEIMQEKKTNLCLSADVFTKSELLNLANVCGPEICMIKTHVDVIKDFDLEMIQTLSLIAQKHNFLILEDRKFADIGEIVQKQFNEGLFKISSWADCVTCHMVSGPGILDGLRAAGKGKSFGVLLIESMSSSGSLSNDTFSQQCVKASDDFSDIVMGFICQKSVQGSNDGLLCCTPGVNLEDKGDNLGQNYNSPDSVLFGKNSDVIIVGRGIYKQKDPLEAAKLYRKKGWEAYLKKFE